MRRLLTLLTALALLALLPSCGPTSITQTNQTERFSVTMTIDGNTVADRLITLTISDRGGAPAQVDAVVIAPVMQEMGMAEPEATASQTAPGRYEWRGRPFTMIGQWQLNVRIAAGGREDTTTFIVDAK